MVARSRRKKTEQKLWAASLRCIKFESPAPTSRSIRISTNVLDDSGYHYPTTGGPTCTAPATSRQPLDL